MKGWAWLVLLVGCTEEEIRRDPPADPTTVGADVDQDGAHATVDCDDQDPAVHPGAEEVPCNGLDDDCDGRPAPGTCTLTLEDASLTVPPGPTTAWWTIGADLDGDGWAELQVDELTSYGGTLRSRWIDARDPGNSGVEDAVVAIEVTFDHFDAFRWAAVGETDGEPGADIWLGRFLFQGVRPGDRLVDEDAVATYVLDASEPWTPASLADIDGDGLQDLVFWTGGQQRAVLAPFDGEVVVSHATSVAVAQPPLQIDGSVVHLAPFCPDDGAVAVGDVTGDGVQDVGCRQGEDLLLFAGPFSGDEVADPIAVYVGTPSFVPLFADATGDDVQDLLVLARGEAWIVPGGAVGRFEDSSAVAPWRLRTGDLTPLVGRVDPMAGTDLLLAGWQNQRSRLFRNIGF
ncbi:MAG: putative metal-binding motif-containing protein [Alphaproteobacteria bacterium]|nr:putative metal-binding motif-containing protein [Alphaproteobacteria bacterium]MCB9699728.1 putative metal-binding motif-containing protein [Alphaproteobacteria bacterium]